MTITRRSARGRRLARTLAAVAATATVLAFASPAMAGGDLAIGLTMGITKKG